MGGTGAKEADESDNVEKNSEKNADCGDGSHW
jgi:hypothetical protein